MKKLLNLVSLIFLVCLVLLTAACTKRNLKQQAMACDCPPVAAKPETILTPEPQSELKSAIVTADYALLKPAQWSDIDGLSSDD